MFKRFGYLPTAKQFRTTQATEMNTDLVGVLTAPIYQKVQHTKVLVVGAGGIGCELLKNLVLSGFHDIEIIDLDTIDVSNLNRQFLFRKEHVGKSKAQVAREAALRFNPAARVTAHHKNIKSAEFGLDYFKRFTLVMNALDNLDARRHVNRMCLAADVPMLESGTAGYLGQVSVIKKGVTECFECQPKAAPKTYPVCTIRSNPTTPIHCIVWAKYLFECLFGKANDMNSVTDLDGPGEEAEACTEKGFQYWIFHKVFHIDIVKLSSMEDLWKGKTPPQPLSLAQLSSKATVATEGTAALLKDQVVWNLEQNANNFLQSAAKLHKLHEELRELAWDKDDSTALDFVTSAANLRASIFGIPLQSRFDVKEKAGNIIAAIATTNAVIAGLIVIEALKIIGGSLDKCYNTYLQKRPSRKRLLQPLALESPNPNCYVCARPFLTLRININTTSMGDFVNRVLRGALGMLEPTVMVEENIVFESGEDVEPDFVTRQSQKFLAECRVTNNSVMIVEDFMQDLSLHITISHSDDFPPDAQPFEVIGNVPQQQVGNTSSAESGKMDLDDEVVEVTPLPESVHSRKRALASTAEAPNKRGKKNGDEIIL